MLHKNISLWDGYTYKITDDTGFKPTFDTYILSGDKKRPAILICPGGAYQYTSDREAEAIALQFNAAGFHAFVLNYTVGSYGKFKYRTHGYRQPLLDLSRAMCIIRDNADAWNINPNKIAVSGFSAGGHLAASLGVHWNKPYIKNISGITEGLNKPNALILAYPVISSEEFAHQTSFKILFRDDQVDNNLMHEMSLEHHISKETPPSFIWHTVEDSTVPVENSMIFAMGLRKLNIPFELHIYPNGPHGLSLSTEETAANDSQIEPHVASWMPLCIEWFKSL